MFTLGLASSRLTICYNAIMPDLAPDLSDIAALLEARPEPVRNAFNYCLCVMMVEASKMNLVLSIPGDQGTLCVFRTIETGEETAVTT